MDRGRPSRDVGAVDPGARAPASTNRATRSGSLRGRSPATRGASTPGRDVDARRPAIPRSAPATFAGSSPPARMTGQLAGDRGGQRGGGAGAGAARDAAAGRVEQEPLGPGRRGGRGRLDGASATAAAGSRRRLGRQVEDLPDGSRRRRRDLGRRLAAVELDRVRVEPADDLREPLRSGVDGDGDDPGRRRTRPVPPDRAGDGGRARPPRRASRARGVPGTRFSPIASAPARTAASTPAASVIPQIFTNGSRSRTAGSSGTAPAATKAAAAAAGSAARTRASPMSAASNPTARQPATVSGFTDAGLGDRQAVVRDRGAQPDRTAPGRPRGSAGRGC